MFEGLLKLLSMEKNYNGITSPHFSQTLHYELSSPGATPCYNGNVSAVDWTALDAMAASIPTGHRYTFDYDEMNRLTDITLVDNNHWTSSSQEISYDGKGNMLERTDAGQYGYSASLPYAMSELSSPAASIPMRDQYLHYNAMQLPDTIIENCDTATFSYYGDMSRAAMVVTGPSGYRYACDYYDQQYNEFSKTVGNATSHKAVLWLGGTPYTAPAALLKDYGENTWQVVHVLRDNLGSITHVIDTTGVVLQEMAYTAWGQLRNPQNGTVYAADAQPELLLGRGYTGHEHLPWFGLVNMNARLYDPAVGRFLSPDPFVQAPDNTQNFNRYSYCLNNPLRYVDQDGKKVYIKIGGLLYEYRMGEDGNYDLYSVDTGLCYSGDDDFGNSVKNSLSSIMEGDAGYVFISNLVSSDAPIYIKKGDIRKTEYGYLDGQPTIAVTWLEGKSIGPSYMNGQYYFEAPDFISLAHELGHAYDVILGTIDRTVWYYKDGNTILQAEWFACFIENVIRYEQNLPIRTHYSYTIYEYLGMQIHILDSLLSMPSNIYQGILPDSLKKYFFDQ